MTRHVGGARWGRSGEAEKRTMLVALDVKYEEDDRAAAAGVVFRDWRDAGPVSEYVAVRDEVEPYVPGLFYRRELPCLLAVLAIVREPIDVAVIDGYVRLGEAPGLGMHLWHAVGGRFAVIGAAKSRFRNADALPVFRGASKRPLFVSAVGIEPSHAVHCILAMHDPYRIPTLLRKAHDLACHAASDVRRST